MPVTRGPALLCLLLLAPPLLAAPVPAGGKAKDVPELPVAADAMAVVQLNGITRTKGRVLKMLEGVDAELAKTAATKIDELIQSALENRDLAGIDQNGRVFVAVGSFADLGNADPPVAVILPVPDLKTFREKFLTAGERKSFESGKGGVSEFETEAGGKTIYVADNKAGYLTLTPNKELAETYAGKYEMLTAKKLGSVHETLLTADVSLFINLERVNAVYGEQIKQGKGFFALMMQQQGMGLDPKQMQAARVFVDGLFQVIEDATGLVIAVEARPEGANLRFDAAFGADTPSAKALAVEKPNPLKALAELPKGMSSYTASKWGKTFTDMMRTMGGEFAAPQGDDKTADAIEKLLDLLVTSADGETVTVAGPEQSSLTATAYADPGKVTAARLKVMKMLTGGASYSNIVLKENPVVKENDQKHAGFTLTAASIEVDYQASVKNAKDEAAKEAAVEAMKKMVPEKQTVWFGTDGKRYVQVTAQNWATAKGLLDGFAAPKAKAGDDAAFALTRKQLPDEAGFLALYDTAGLLNTLADYAGSVAGAIPVPGVEVPKVGKITGDPAYIGVGFTAKPQSARLDLFVPTGAMKVMRKAADGAEKKD